MTACLRVVVADSVPAKVILPSMARYQPPGSSRAVSRKVAPSFDRLSNCFVAPTAADAQPRAAPRAVQWENSRAGSAHHEDKQQVGRRRSRSSCDICSGGDSQLEQHLSTAAAEPAGARWCAWRCDRRDANVPRNEQLARCCLFILDVPYSKFRSYTIN